MAQKKQSNRFKPTRKSRIPKFVKALIKKKDLYDDQFIIDLQPRSCK